MRVVGKSGFVQFLPEEIICEEEGNTATKRINVLRLNCSFCLQPFCSEWIHHYHVKNQQLTWLLCLTIERAPRCRCICCFSHFDNILPLWLSLACVYAWVFLWCVCGFVAVTDCTLERRKKKRLVVSFLFLFFQVVAGWTQYMTSHATPALFSWPLYLPAGLHVWKVLLCKLSSGVRFDVVTGPWKPKEAHWKKS